MATSLYTSLCSHCQLSRYLLNAPAVFSAHHQHREEDTRCLKIRHHALIPIHSSIPSEGVSGPVLDHFLESEVGEHRVGVRTSSSQPSSSVLHDQSVPGPGKLYQTAQQTSIFVGSWCLNTCRKALVLVLHLHFSWFSWSSQSSSVLQLMLLLT